eukprot:Platyproteum_vivax@DN2460_c0_g1_i1.p1
MDLSRFGDEEDEHNHPLVTADQFEGGSDEAPSPSQYREVAFANSPASPQEEEEAGADALFIGHRKRPRADRQMISATLPAGLDFDPEPFNRQTFAKKLKLAEQVIQDLEAANGNVESEQEVLSRLKNLNTIRWQFVKDADGNPVMNEDGKPRMESNAQLVEWESGAWELWVGTTGYSVLWAPERIHLFQEFGEMSLMHAILNKRMTFAPLLMRHSNRLKDLLEAKHAAMEKSRTRVSSGVELEADDLLEAQRVAEEKAARARTRKQKSKGSISAAYLETDEETWQGGGEIGKIKAHFANTKKK